MRRGSGMILAVSGPWDFPNRHHLYTVLDVLRPRGLILVRDEHPRDIWQWCATRYADEWWTWRLRMVDTAFLAFGTITAQHETTARNLPDAVLALPIENDTDTPTYCTERKTDTRRHILTFAKRYGVPILYAGAGDHRTARRPRKTMPRWRRESLHRRRRRATVKG